ncbi:IclR family transcriptional regulator domain-containing protein [Paramicrobacterium fandaimingii]|uniref:IclR family transcriptional regulator domain-containing protein n=1 Tax=Paramicrobacterium fandaimingii TaxID=2708079 RepID=UPI0014209C40|nr:IclR family transcriptional regulator C-terminal domain-containing protein [Microbacterium fandaimingii]
MEGVERALELPPEDTVQLHRCGLRVNGDDDASANAGVVNALQRKDALKPYRMRSRVGLGIPMHSTGMGKVVLANIRARGYGFDFSENEPGTVCVSAPIRDHTGAVTHGLSVSSIALEHPGTTIEQFAPQAVAAANEISRLLGAPNV